MHVKFDEIYKMYKVLQTSDNFYYQSIKGLSDMSVHNYFSHFDTPFDAYASYLNILYDFEYYIKKELSKADVDKNDKWKDKQKQYEKNDEAKKESLIKTNIIVANDDSSKTESIYSQNEEDKKDKRYDTFGGFIIA